MQSPGYFRDADVTFDSITLTSGQARERPGLLSDIARDTLVKTNRKIDLPDRDLRLTASNRQ